MSVYENLFILFYSFFFAFSGKRPVLHFYKMMAQIFFNWQGGPSDTETYKLVLCLKGKHLMNMTRNKIYWNISASVGRRYQLQYQGVNTFTLVTRWIRVNPYQVRLNRLCGVGLNQTSLVVFDDLLCCQPSWMLAFTRNHQNGCHCPITKDWYLKQEPNTTKLWSICKLNILSANLKIDLI